MSDTAGFYSDRLQEEKILRDLDQSLRQLGQERSSLALHEGHRNLTVRVQSLVQVLGDADAEESLRAAAAVALGASAESSRKHCGGNVVDEVMAAVPALVESTRDEASKAVREAAIVALAEFCPQAASDVVVALLDGPLENHSAPEVIHALRTLRRCGRAAATSDLISRLDDLLQDGETAVRQASCEILALFGQAAAEEILLKTVLDDQDDSVRSEAARTLVQMDESETFLVHTVRRSSRPQTRNLRRGGRTDNNIHQAPQATSPQDRVLTELRRVGSGGSDLAVQLSARWNAITPPEGYRRLQITEIHAFIFGAQEGVTNKTLRRWMDQRRLSAIQIGESLYDVSIADLEHLREIHHGPAGQAGPVQPDDEASDSQRV